MTTQVQELQLNVPVTTGNHYEDIPEFVDNPVIIAARNFLRGRSHPLAYYRTVVERLRVLKGTVEERVADELLNAIEVKYVNIVDAEFNAANAQRKGGDTKAVKPRELFPKYHADLKAIWERGGQASMAAHGLFTDMYLEQTMSEGDLMNTDWIDPYTREEVVPVEDRDLEVYIEELDDELEESPKLRRHYRAMQLLLKAIFWDDPELKQKQKLPQSDLHKEILRWAEESKQEMGYDDAYIQKFIGAQMEGFDAESEAEIVPDDDTDDYTPPPLLKDFEISPVAWEQIGPVVGAFQSRRNRAFEKCAQKHYTRDGAIAYFKDKVLTVEYVNFLRAQLYIATKEDITTAAVAYLKMASEFGIKEEWLKLYNPDENFCLKETDIANLRIVHPSRTLLKFVNEFFNDLWEMVQTPALYKYDDTEAWKGVGEYSNATIRSISENMPKYHPNPVMTGAFNVSFVMAVMGGADWPQAEGAAWAGWRLDIDPKAAKAYDQAFAASQSRSKAMRAFWDACDPRVPRPQDKVKAVLASKNGLRLESGREIDWNIAARKIKNGELDLGLSEEAQYVLNINEQQKRLKLSDETVRLMLKKAGIQNVSNKPAGERLLARLKELNCGQNIWPLLEQSADDGVSIPVIADQFTYELVEQR
jgi:hypothetical protein